MTPNSLGKPCPATLQVQQCDVVPPASCTSPTAVVSDVTDTCSNGVTDAADGETDVDCGGPCSGCGESKSCRSAVDCDYGLQCGAATLTCVGTFVLQHNKSVAAAPTRKHATTVRSNADVYLLVL